MPRKKISRADWVKLIDEEHDRVVNFTGRVMVNVSGGCASAVCWHRCIELYGRDRVFPVFADTRSEDADLYRFLDDCEKVFGQTLVRLDQGKDIWDVFDEKGIMRIAKSGNACKASVELKQKPLNDYFAAKGFDGQAIGIQFDEPERIEAFRRRKDGTALFPLVAKPHFSECAIHDQVKRIGLTVPYLYTQDFMHNNCGGGCILAGLAQWNAVRVSFPERFENAKIREKAFFDRTGFTILRDQRNGEVKPYTLEELQTDAEAGRKFGNDWRSQCSCMEEPKLFSDDDCF